MEWNTKLPKTGGMIRVKVNFYYHYGIFEDEDHVYAFGLPDNTGLNPNEIAVVVTDIATFLHGGLCETAVLSFKEKRQAHKPQAVIAYAREHLGMKGYNILHNNCEHFAYACVFGEENARSSFVDSVRSEIRNRL